MEWQYAESRIGATRVVHNMNGFTLTVLRWLVIFVAACGHAGVDSRLAVSPSEPDARQRARDVEIAARAAPLVDAFSNRSAVLAPDGQIVFVSTRDGLPQLYVGELGQPDRS